MREGDGETREQAAARLLRLLDERSRKRKRLVPPPLIADQLEFELLPKSGGNQSVLQEKRPRFRHRS